MGDVMKKIWGFLGMSFTLLGGLVYAYQHQEVVFDSSTVPIAYEIYDGELSHVERILGYKHFAQRVQKSDIPAVVIIGASGNTMTPDQQELFSHLKKTGVHVAQKYHKRVRVFSMNALKHTWFFTLLSKKLNMKNFDLPLCVFFNQGELVTPLVSGVTQQEQLIEEIKRRFSL
jgi:hypothetical protein